jgi:hypothetical protein
VRTAFGRLAHTFGHAPQWSGSLAVSTHWPLQSVVPVGHEVAHELCAQT